MTKVEKHRLTTKLVSLIGDVVQSFSKSMKCGIGVSGDATNLTVTLTLYPKEKN